MVEPYRPLLPVGYHAGVRAYREAVSSLDLGSLDAHYTAGLGWFHEAFVPHLKGVLEALSGGAWDLSRFRAFAAGSDVDLISHVVEAVASREPVALYPGDWYGFLVGSTWRERIAWSRAGEGALRCLCVPSVRNGHFTEEMLAFLDQPGPCLLNVNLFPTLAPAERAAVATRLKPLLERAMLSVSFSRGFGLTASQLGVMLVHEDHPFARRFEAQWAWHTYFHNAIAARTFMALDVRALAAVDDARRRWVGERLRAGGLPALETGSYYVRSFRVEGDVPARLAPLAREGVVRLCFKPPLHGRAEKDA